MLLKWDMLAANAQRKAASIWHVTNTETSFGLKYSKIFTEVAILCKLPTLCHMQQSCMVLPVYDRNGFVPASTMWSRKTVSTSYERVLWVLARLWSVAVVRLKIQPKTELYTKTRTAPSRGEHRVLDSRRVYPKVKRPDSTYVLIKNH